MTSGTLVFRVELRWN